MSKIQEIFGKNSGITLSDIENAIKSDLLHENDEIELTDADRFMNKRKLINKIVSEIVSFLNSGRGTGLLFLGLGESDDKINIKCVKSFKTKEQIKASVFSKIGIIPTNTKPFKMVIIPISCNDGNIFLVEVQSNDLDCIYYSKIDNDVYIRQGDGAKSLDLPDFLELLAKKNYARIYLELVEKTNNVNETIFNIRLINEGLEPVRFITISISILTSDDLEYSILGQSIRKNDSDPGKIDYGINKDINLKVEKIELEVIDSLKKTKNLLTNYSGTAGYPPNSTLIYPTVSSTIGTLSIEKKDINMYIEVDTYESRGHTNQIVYIKSCKSKITVKESSRLLNHI